MAKLRTIEAVSREHITGKRAQVQLPFETSCGKKELLCTKVGCPTALDSPGSLNNNAATLTKLLWCFIEAKVVTRHKTINITVEHLWVLLSIKSPSSEWPLPILNPVNTVTLPIFIWKLLNECSLMYFIWSINLMAKSARALICVFPSLSYVESFRPDAAIYVLPMVLIFSSCRNWSSLIICFTRAKEVNKPW